MDTQLDEQIDEIMCCFDWQHVANVMKMLNWRWATVKDYEVPSVEDLQRCAMGLMTDLVRSYQQDTQEWQSLSTGGLVARIDSGPRGPVLSLAFELCSTRPLMAEDE